MDIATIWNDATASGDYVLEGGSLRVDEGLKTAVIISLFTDRRAATDDVLPSPTSGRRGWWGSLFLERPLGSRLWLLAREKQSQDALNRAREYALESLIWLVEDGIAKAVEAKATAPQRGLLHLEIIIYKPDGDITNFHFQRLWDALLTSDDADDISAHGLGFIYDGNTPYDGLHDYSGIL